MLYTVPVVGTDEPVEQHAGWRGHVHLPRDRHALVELREHWRQDGLHARRVELRVCLEGVEPVLTETLDHIPDVHLLHYNKNIPNSTSCPVNIQLPAASINAMSYNALYCVSVSPKYDLTKMQTFIYKKYFVLFI